MDIRMKLSERDKKLLIVLILIAVVVLGYYFIYLPFTSRISKLSEEVDGLEVTYTDLQNKQISKEDYLSQLKIIDYKDSLINERLPSFIEQERVILTLKELTEKTGFVVNSPSFSRVVPISGSEEADLSQAEEQKNILASIKELTDIKIDELAKIDGELVEKEEERFVALSDIPDGSGIKLEVKFSYTSTYNELKSFLYEVSQYKNKIIVSNLTLQGVGNEIGGGMMLSFYGYMERDRALPKWNNSVNKGKKNPFDTYAGYTGIDYLESLYDENGNIENSDNESNDNSNSSSDSAEKKYTERDYDFYLILNPITDDAPAVILGKGGQMGSEIYGDANRMNEVIIELEEREGLYYYRYKTSHYQYPKVYEEWKEFEPVKANRGTIILKIIDSKRLNLEDKSGADVRIVNKTGMKVLAELDREIASSRAKISFEGEGEISVKKQ